ncbi:hypothetical protein RVR_6106 [Actinacidiphila reveromycinica]|uniref:Uncharacterized protein n=1 Tax=Actinacidiphila reveromycinica TaxID=659352 RepID=A0A7U3UVD4_9ACTN|nr:hypothetical protein [Streptomyces sp. SN-593]BBA99473.1 hypothetical protein RVR_6106 [Streptomyces sp. SN-593]
MPATTPEWHLSLLDSVRALAAATEELRAAHQHARHTARTADPARIIPVPGLLTVPGNAEPVRPHDEALWQLSDLYMVLEHHTHGLYENAALGYAHGTANAMSAVLRAEHPHHAELPRDRNGNYRLTADDLPDLSDSLTAQAGARDLTDLRTRLIACEQAQDTEEDDVETELSTVLADTAHAYGQHAERALHHLIHYADTHGFLCAS